MNVRKDLLQRSLLCMLFYSESTQFAIEIVLYWCIENVVLVQSLK